MVGFLDGKRLEHTGRDSLPPTDSVVPRLAVWEFTSGHAAWFESFDWSSHSLPVILFQLKSGKRGSWLLPVSAYWKLIFERHKSDSREIRERSERDPIDCSFCLTLSPDFFQFPNLKSFLLASVTLAGDRNLRPHIAWPLQCGILFRRHIGIFHQMIQHNILMGSKLLSDRISI